MTHNPLPDAQHPAPPDAARADALSTAKNGYRTRAAVLDHAPVEAQLDAPTKRALRLTQAVGAEGTGRKVARHSQALREALACLSPPESALGADVARDWASSGLLADALLELMESVDVTGAQWRRLFDCWCRLVSLKAARRAELGPILQRVNRGDDPISRLMAGGAR